MKEFLLDALQIVLSALIPVVVAYACAFFKKKTAQIAAQTENEKAKHYINEISNAVITAVTATSQTYVDALKGENAFTAEAQKEALERTYKTAMAIISPAALAFVTDVYGDLEGYLTAKIEETVRNQKQTATLVTGIATLDEIETPEE